VTVEATVVTGVTNREAIACAYVPATSTPTSSGNVVRLAPRSELGSIEVERMRKTGLRQSTFFSP
jgi:hypothetical protein